MATWRKTSNGLNWGTGGGRSPAIILNISKKFKVNTVVGYTVRLYDFSKSHSFSKAGRVLKTFKTKSQAVAFAKLYVRKH
tara:strand:+ start:197 stop:436 length:240 start_codon:yes stop_codon:yes gene_type:complete